MGPVLKHKPTSCHQCSQYEVFLVSCGCPPLLHLWVPGQANPTAAIPKRAEETRRHPIRSFIREVNGARRFKRSASPISPTPICFPCTTSPKNSAKATGCHPKTTRLPTGGCGSVNSLRH